MAALYGVCGEIIYFKSQKPKAKSQKPKAKSQKPKAKRSQIKMSENQVSKPLTFGRFFYRYIIF